MELFVNPQAQLMFSLIIGIIGAYCAGYLQGLEKAEAKIKKQ